MEHWHVGTNTENKAPYALPRGLTQAEVAEREAAGLTNTNADIKTKSIKEIMLGHALTLFNAVNLCLAVLVLITGHIRNMMFMFVVLINFGIGVFQEVRAKRQVDKLTILTAKRIRVVRDGVERAIDVDKLVVDDIILLSHGEQVPADCVVISGQADLNESLLTGESDAIEKRAGSELLSGSFVESGALLARVCRVGSRAYAAQISSEAKFLKPVKSQIRDTLNMIIAFGTYAIVPLGVGLFVRTHMDGAGVSDSILTTVAAVIGMIPQGLVLLTSSVLALATTRLARRRVLVQQAYCVEALARVDVLCLDKTGTITSGAMDVSGVHPAEADEFAPGETPEALIGAAAVVRANRADANETARAILIYADEKIVPRADSARAIPFSSARKYSGVTLADGRSYVLGAAQFVMGARFGEVEARVRSFDALERVLIVARVDGFDEKGAIVGEPHAVGFVTVRDHIRISAPYTVGYFKKQGVALKVISGDDPRTVSAIAAAVGIEGAERYVDMSAVGTVEEFREAIRTNVVFGRVTPERKREIVRALRFDGHTVAMTGDGVNDVLALKEADCSISMATGSAAARNVSEIVLADDDFSHMPEVVDEGRRSINNLQRSASLFLVKTVFSALLAIVCILFPPYPFIPIQMTLISATVIGLPSFVLALEPNHERVKGHFLANVLARSLPASVGIVIALFGVVLTRDLLGLTFEEGSTVCMMLTLLVGIALVVKISQPLTPLRWALLIVVAILSVGGIVFFPKVFLVSRLTVRMAILFVIAGAAALFSFLRLFERLVKDVNRGGRFLGTVSRLERKHARRRR